MIPLIHGRDYFARLRQVLEQTNAGDRVLFTDWRGDPDERLDGPGSEVVDLLVAVARRGVEVKGLVWRSHPDRTRFSEEENRTLAKDVNEAGGEVLLDERVRRAGSHHQKLVVVLHPNDPTNDVAFVGGIDLCHGRNDDERHLGDPQAIEIDPRYGPTPAWHDMQVELHGPAVGDIAETFGERWNDPTPARPRDRGRGQRTPTPVASTTSRSRVDRTPSDPAARTPSRCCAPTRPSARATRSRRAASAASPGPT